jgi:hypothetical protein
VGSGWSEPYTFSDNDAYSYEAVANVGPLGQADLIFPADRSGRLSTLRAYHLDQNAAWHGQTIANYASGIHLSGSTFAAAINARGDAIATWMRRESAGGPWRVFARYGASGSDFGSTRQLANRGRTPVAAIDSSGAASVAFQQRSGEAIETMFAYRPASGYWTRPTAVSTTNSSLAFPPISLKTNAKGDFFVESEGQHLADGVLVADHRLTHCVEGTCGSDQVVQGPRGDQPMAVAVRPIGAVDILWTFGCATEECIPTGIRAARFWAQ